MILFLFISIYITFQKCRWPSHTVWAHMCIDSPYTCIHTSFEFLRREKSVYQTSRFISYNYWCCFRRKEKNIFIIFKAYLNKTKTEAVQIDILKIIHFVVHSLISLLEEFGICSGSSLLTIDLRHKLIYSKN